MRRNALALIAAVGCLISMTWSGAHAQCAAVPNTLTNGQPTDATQVMGNFSALTTCLNTGQFVDAPSLMRQFTGPGGGIITMQNPSATTNYNFNLPATAGSAGSLLTSGGGGSSPNTWTNTSTSGHALPFLDGSNTWSGTQTFGPSIGTVSTQSGTTYTLSASDCGTTIRFTSSAAATVTTLNSLPIGCAIAIEQAGSGQVTVSAGSGATQHSSHSFTKTFGQYAILGLFVDINAGGTAANVIVTGDGA